MNELDATPATLEAPAVTSDLQSGIIAELKRRCSAANLTLNAIPENLAGESSAFTLEMRSGRDHRKLYISAGRDLTKLLSINFEKYIFLSGFDAICSYSDDIIEAALRSLDAPLRALPANRRFSDLSFVLEPPQPGFPKIEVGRASEEFVALLTRPRIWGPRVFTLKIIGSGISTHDQALAQLRKTADAVFFQIDLLSDIALSLVRERRRMLRRPRKEPNLTSDLQYPPTEFDDAPISLYWYERSATGMPLLQFLAFYQVIEFYFPTYSHAEAQRKLKVILKDPTFRGDRDADVGRLLSAIQVSQRGAFGDERSQLRSTLFECTNPESLREFLASDPQRQQYYSAKTKIYHKIPIANPTADLRDDVANRIYDIRCRIVHMKNDARDGEVELLLPFTKEAEQLSFDIELVHYLAQQVLIAAGTPFRSLK
jgi:hypothetical protein